MNTAQVVSEVNAIFGHRRVDVVWDENEQYEGWLNIYCHILDYDDINQLRKVSHLYIGTITACGAQISIRCYYESL